MNIYALIYNGNYGYNLIEEKSKMGVCGGRFVALGDYDQLVKEIEDLESRLSAAENQMSEYQIERYLLE